MKPFGSRVGESSSWSAVKGLEFPGRGSGGLGCGLFAANVLLQFREVLEGPIRGSIRSQGLGWDSRGPLNDH